MSNPEHKTVGLTIRISPDLKRRVSEAIDNATPYRITLTNFMERGIELALKELAEMRGKKSK